MPQPKCAAGGHQDVRFQWVGGSNAGPSSAQRSNRTALVDLNYPVIIKVREICKYYYDVARGLTFNEHIFFEALCFHLGTLQCRPFYYGAVMTSDLTFSGGCWGLF